MPVFESDIFERYESSFESIDNMMGLLIVEKSNIPEDFMSFSDILGLLVSSHKSNNFEQSTFIKAIGFLTLGRQLEIFKYRYVQSLFSTIVKIKSNLTQLDLHSTLFHLRSFIEISSQYLCVYKNMIEDFDQIPLIKSQDIFYPNITKKTELMLGDLCQKMVDTNITGSINWRLLGKDINTPEKIAEFLNPSKKSKNIISFLKTVEKDIPELHPLYASCSEIIHPNSWLTFSGSIDMGLLNALENDDMDELMKKDVSTRTDFHSFYASTESRKNEIFFDVYWSQFIEQFLLPYFKKIIPRLAKSFNTLNKSHQEVFSTCREISKTIIHTSPFTYSISDDYVPKTCPCGSRSNIFECCLFLY